MFALSIFISLPASASIRIRTSTNATECEIHAATRLEAATTGLSEDATILLAPYAKQLEAFPPYATEAFILHRFGAVIVVAGTGPSGVLYGAMELAERIASTHALSATLDY